MKTYSEKLKDPRWQKKRLEILEVDKFTCMACGDKETTLHVHHMVYDTVNIWDAENHDLITLCEKCHKLYHFLLNSGYDIAHICMVIKVWDLWESKKVNDWLADNNIVDKASI